MKNFTLFLAVFGLFFLNSCSSSDDGGEDPVQVTLTSMTVASNNNQINLSFGDGNFVFSVQKTYSDGSASNANDNVTYYVNNDAISGNTFTPTAVGTYTVQAKEGDVDSNTITVTVIDEEETLTSITVSADPETINLFSGDDQSFEFSVQKTYSFGTTSTSTDGVTFSVDGTPISGDSWTPMNVGSYSVTASEDGVTSDAITVEVIDEEIIAYEHNVLVEDMTGTWCGWCTRVLYALELIAEESDNVIAVGVHNGDTMANSYSNSLINAAGVNGFPSTRVNRQDTWQPEEHNNWMHPINQVQDSSPIGISINSDLSSTGGDITVGLKFSESMSNMSFGVYVLVDGTIESQTNYYTGGQVGVLYNGQNPVSNYEHNHALIWHNGFNGSSLTNSETSMGSTVTKTVSASLSGVDVNDLNVVVFVRQGNTVVNAQIAKANENLDYVLAN